MSPFKSVLILLAVLLLTMASFVVLAGGGRSVAL